MERQLASIAASSHGVVTRRELLRAGISGEEIKRRLRTGALLREHPGVYRVGHRAPSIEATYLAAVRACGERALLSGRAAGHLLGALKGPPPPPEVIAPTERRMPGVTSLRRVLRGDVHVTLSALERRFLARLREAGLQLPQINQPAGGRRVDCRWPTHRLTVELDGYRYHHSRHAWERDRHREREARARGDELRRYTYRDVVEDPQPMPAELRALLQ